MLELNRRDATKLIGKFDFERLAVFEPREMHHRPHHCPHQLAPTLQSRKGKGPLSHGAINNCIRKCIDLSDEIMRSKLINRRPHGGKDVSVHS